MVPSGWERKPIKELCESIIDCVNKTAKHVDYVTPFKMIRTTNVRNGRVDIENVRYVEEDIYKQWIRRGAPKDGDIIFTREAPVGEAGILENSEGVFLGQRTMMYRSHPERADNRFLFYSLTSAYCQKQIDDFSNGGTVAHMRVPDCGELMINTPPILEQRKIAKILSTWDKAINTTECLIDNSKQQKKALMQQLLTGQKRLLDDSGKPFEGEWEDLYLHDVAKIIVSPVDKKTVEGEIPVELCNYTDVYYNTRITKSLDFMKATAKQTEIDKFTLQVNDVIVTKDSETPGDIAVPALVSEDLNGVVCGYHLAIIRPQEDKVEGTFLNYLFSMPKTRYYFFTLATGATRFGLSVGGINKAHFTLPPLIEQQKIAAVLTSADKEIEFLEQQLADFKQEKKALMQQVLTGKSRVKVEEDEVAL
ncbi:restriction endonuclease subunit S [Psychrobium sp. 1_MG-2023]|uniref:restriction endonuclease subunit S n=1 Tax=Psychrobium sp. 1_MG-2023 TaxID=3062624 RepID=UPI00273256DB|nr:restriction endonuclease subunit S [Psychrobium sp. 1_MG-2023]MDP2562780.1 restriction endonuclease subunit S [Psychrobium sp. 1_MG-2023]